VVDDPVFYNPYARFSRSLGISVLVCEAKLRGKDIVVGDVMAATGVRGIRYYLESASVLEVWFNDRSRAAYENIKRNVVDNGVRAKVFNIDVRSFLFSDGLYRLDFIDLDPFGSPAPYIDALVSSVRKGGLVAITATDLTALCGLYPSAAFRKYASLVRKTWFCHEAALRILIRSVLDSAGRHGRYIKPVLSVFSEQYARIYVRVFEGRLRFPYEYIGYIILSGDKVNVYSLMRIGEGLHIPSGSIILGPLWIGPLHDKEFIRMILDGELYNYILVGDDRDRAKELFNILMEEVDLPPYYFDLHTLCSRLRISPPRLKVVMDRLVELGYRVGRTQFSPYGFKSDCPLDVLMNVLRSLPR